MDQKVGCIVNGMHMTDQPYLRSCDIGRGIIETNRKGSVRTRSAEQKERTHCGHSIGLFLLARWSLRLSLLHPFNSLEIQGQNLINSNHGTDEPGGSWSL